MASVSKGRGQSRWSCRRKLRPMRCSLLVFSMSLVLFLLLGVGNSAAAGRHAAGGGGKKTKAGLGATGSDIITITSKNFRETVRFQSDISKSGGGQIPPPVFPLSFAAGAYMWGAHGAGHNDTATTRRSSTFPHPGGFNTFTLLWHRKRRGVSAAQPPEERGQHVCPLSKSESAEKFKQTGIVRRKATARGGT